jgi:hypothetical protein
MIKDAGEAVDEAAVAEGGEGEGEEVVVEAVALDSRFNLNFLRSLFIPSWFFDLACTLTN